MTDRPILFSAPMVRALLAGTKTQTRRAVKLTDFGRSDTEGYDWHFRDKRLLWNDVSHAQLLRMCPYGGPQDGTRLWVKETHQYAGWTEDGMPLMRYQADGATKWFEGEPPEEWGEKLTDIWAALSEPSNFNIDGKAADRKWRPSIHMPRWASRITLEVTNVRVERLQDINGPGHQDDVLHEGWPFEMAPQDRSPVLDFRDLWESINGAGSWAVNPWVWVIEFKRVAVE